MTDTKTLSPGDREKLLGQIITATKALSYVDQINTDIIRANLEGLPDVRDIKVVRLWDTYSTIMKMVWWMAAPLRWISATHYDSSRWLTIKNPHAVFMVDMTIKSM